MSVDERERWWGETADWLDQAPDDDSVAARIRAEMDSIPADEHRPFLGRAWTVLLGRRRRYGAGLYLLQSTGDPECLLDLVTPLLPLPGLQADDEEEHLAELVRILAAAGRPRAVRGRRAR